MPGLPTTFERLANTENEAAVPVLLGALDAPQREVRDLALAALLTRRNSSAELLLLRRWEHLSPRWKQQIAERLGWLSAAIRTALVNGDAELFHNACAAAIFTRDYEAIPLLATARGAASPLATPATAAALELAEQLADELAAPRDYRVRRDPQLQRNHVLAGLERSVAEGPPTCRREIMEAFLLLAPRDHAVLQRILRSPGDRAFPLLTDILSASSRPGVERLLLSYLDDAHAPLAAIQIIGRRGDVSFLRQLARKIGAEPTPAVQANLQRIENIPWMESNLSVLDALRDSEQPGAVHLAVGSGVPRHLAAEVTAYMARHGKIAGRRVAARALAEFHQPAADELTIELLADEDACVRAAAAGQLRRRNLPGAIQRLLALLNSPHAEERDVAQAELAEFRFEPFAANFEALSPAAKTAAGLLVRQVDPFAVSRVESELRHESRSRRRRALELAVALHAVEGLAESILDLLRDEDQYLRIEALRTLATVDGPLTRQALRDALVDTEPLVQEAAESELRRLGCRDWNQPPASAASNETVALAALAPLRSPEGSTAPAA